MEDGAPVDLAGREAVAALAALISDLPEGLRRQALTHSSWTERRVESFERLAFLGDSVLGLSVAGSLYGRFPDVAAGGLTKIHNQAVSGVSCAAVGRLLGVPEMLRANEPEDVTAAIPAEVLLDGERPLPEATEALIAACHTAFGFERVASAVAAAFRPRIALQGAPGGGGGRGGGRVPPGGSPPPPAPRPALRSPSPPSSTPSRSGR